MVFALSNIWTWNRFVFCFLYGLYRRWLFPPMEEFLSVTVPADALLTLLTCQPSDAEGKMQISELQA